jgi:DNA-binding NarL/FixJ family response regulator
MSERLRVVIAEDHYLVREGTRRLLEDTGEIEVLAAVGNATELLDAVRRLSPDAAITDIRMPPGHSFEGIEASHRIRADHPDVGVVVLSQHADPEYAAELLKHGASGLAYLLKDRLGEVDELVRALRAVAAGGSVIDSAVVEALLTHRTRDENSPLVELSPRELDVLREMAQGKANKGIGDVLLLSESSVEKYVHSIFIKLDLAQESQLHRRVLAVLTFLRESGRLGD